MRPPIITRSQDHQPARIPWVLALNLRTVHVHKRLYGVMTELKRYFWPSDTYRRLIHLLGTTVWAGTYGIGIYFFVREASQILHEGIAFFLLDLVTRIVLGLVITALGVLPYLVGSIAAARSGASVTMFVACAVVFVVDVWERVNAIFLSASSTAPLAILFIPFYLAIPVLLVWGLYAAATWLRKP